MKKLMRFALMLAMVLMMVTPATAQVSLNAPQVSLEHETEVASGGVDLGFEVANEGDYAGQCTPGTQFGNTTIPQNNPNVLQYASELDDIVLDGGGSPTVVQYASKMDDVRGGDGSPMTFEPTQVASCGSTIEQSTAAGR